MGRVNRLTERRALRRAADQALLTSLAAPAAQPGGPADRDFVYKRFDRYEPDDIAGSYDHEPSTEPIPVADAAMVEPVDLYDFVSDDGGRRDDRDGLPPSPPPAAPSLPLPTLDFAVSGARPWYRSAPAAAVLVGAVIVAVALGDWLVVRSPSPTAHESAVEQPTSAPAARSTPQPAAVDAPMPPPIPAPPPPPPPPPPPEPTYYAPRQTYQPRYSAPTPADKPRVDVTRAPMSVAPQPKPVPGSDSSTPGDAPNSAPRRRGCFGFC